jgi:hypothetical protein
VDEFRTSKQRENRGQINAANKHELFLTETFLPCRGFALGRAMIVPLVIASERKLKESKTKDPLPY